MENIIIEPVRVAALLNAKDVAKLLKISPSKVYQLMQRGEIATVRMGGVVRVTEQALEEFIERQTIRAAQRWPEDYK